MFAFSVLGFIGQLYLLPDPWLQEAKQLTLRCAHGPYNWLHGNKGEAFFSAKNELGLKSVPRCVKHLAWQTRAVPCCVSPQIGQPGYPL